MRTALALALLLLSFPALAQPVLLDSSDTYVSPLAGVAVLGSQGTAFVVGVDTGRRIAPAVDLGMHLSAGDLTYGAGGAFLTLGPSLGTTHQLGGGVEFDARVLGTATFADVSVADGFGLRRIRGTGQATLSRSFLIVGSLSLAPTVGAYASACQTLGITTTGRCAEAGALAGVDLRFRLFGADMSLPLVLSIPLAGDDRAGEFGVFDVSRAPVTGGLRFRF